MSSSIDLIREIICHDLDPEFLESISISMAWEYSRLYESLARDTTLDDAYRSEEFAKRRAGCATRSLAHSAKKHGVPFNFRRLGCNGQSKILVKAGRVVLIQEPMLTQGDSPRRADYKIELADAHGLIRQLELDLGDQPLRILDWSGTILAVLLHGARGPLFKRDHKRLGGLTLGVSDAAYLEWVFRIDLKDVAMFGLQSVPSLKEPTPTEAESVQSDHVTVSLRTKKKEEAGE